MVIEIGGYYSSDRHIVNIDRIETVSMENSGGGTGDSYDLKILMSTQTLYIRFLSYKVRCEIEYTKLLDALRHRDGELRLPNANTQENKI